MKYLKNLSFVSKDGLFVYRDGFTYYINHNPVGESGRYHCYSSCFLKITGKLYAPGEAKIRAVVQAAQALRIMPLAEAAALLRKDFSKLSYDEINALKDKHINKMLSKIGKAEDSKILFSFTPSHRKSYRQNFTYSAEMKALFEAHRDIFSGPKPKKPRKTRTPKLTTKALPDSDGSTFSAAALDRAEALFIDVETSGVSYSDEAISVGICSENREPIFYETMRPGFASISWGATKAHGLRMRDLSKRPRADVIADVVKILTHSSLKVFCWSEFEADFIRKMLPASSSIEVLPVADFVAKHISCCNNFYAVPRIAEAAYALKMQHQLHALEDARLCALLYREAQNIEACFTPAEGA